MRFSASPLQVAQGAVVTLEWETRNATAISIDDGSGETLGGLPASGSVEVTPAGSSTYRLVAEGKGSRASATVRVEVRQGAPKIHSFAASKGDVARGESVTLSWKVEHADSLRLTTLGGLEEDVSGALPEGEFVVELEESTAYILEARNSIGTVSSRVVVGVEGLPSGFFRAEPTKVEFGDETTLSWEVFGATDLKIGSPLRPFDEELASRGSLKVAPERSTIYTLVATGVGGEREWDAAVEVAPAISSFALAEPGPYRAESLAEVSWVVKGAESLVISNGSGFERAVPAADWEEGIALVPVGASGSIRLTATRDGAESVRTLHVPLTQGPRIARWFASPTAVSLGEDGTGKVRLHWEIEAGESLEIQALPGGAVFPGAAAVAQGSVEVSLSVRTIFRLTAKSATGSATRTLEVDAIPLPRIASLVAIPSRISQGEEVEISWATEGGQALTLERDGTDLQVPGMSASGSWTDQPTADATYVLVATNRLGDSSTATVDVVFGPPEVVSFETSTPVASPAGNVFVSWENEGGRFLEVRDEGDALLCSSSSPAEIARGGCSFVATSVFGRTAISLLVANAAGEEATATLSYLVTDGPAVDSFRASADEVTAGSTVTFSWVVRRDASGRPPVLQLQDDLGNTYDVSGLNPLDDRISLRVEEAGQRIYTFTASTIGTTPWEETASVMVYGIPLLSFEGAPDFVDTAASPLTTLSWTTAHGVLLALHQLDETGGMILPPLFQTTDPASIANGSWDVSPTRVPSVVYRLLVRNPLGEARSADVTVEVDPVRVDSFLSNPMEIISGEQIELSWSVSRAKRVVLIQEALPGVKSLIPDLANSPTATRVNVPATSDAFASIPFPAGFIFPWDGEDHSEAKASTMGYLTFDTEAMTNPFFNVPLPASHAPHVHLAPFWDYLRAQSTGSIWYDLAEDEVGRYLTILWKNFQFEFSTLDASADLTFAIVLRENGQFEFRYGKMTSAGTTASTHPNRAQGNSATIGYQSVASSLNISVDALVAGGLSDRTWILPDQVVFPQGIELFAPHVSTRYRLIATNDHSEQEKALDIQVDLPARILQVAIDPEEPVPGMPFTLSWETLHAVEVEVLAEDGTVLCTAGPDEAQQGSCLLSELEGITTYTVVAQGTLHRNVASQEIVVPVFPPLSVDEFALDEASIRKGEATVLTWATTNAEALELTANGVPVDIGSPAPDSGSLPVSPLEGTVYELTALSHGRTRKAVQTLTVRLASVDNLSLSKTQMIAGESVTLTWATDSQKVFANPPVVEDRSPGSAFIDLRQRSTVRGLASIGDRYGDETFTFPTGFVFPHFGEEKGAIKIFATGMASFDLVRGGAGAIAPMPDPDILSWHLAPFVHTAMGPSKEYGGVFWDRLDVDGEDAVVVQWTGMEFIANAWPGSDLNFQMILFASGAVEYRYGTMAGTSSDVANGSEALIGIQDTSASIGATISFRRPVSGGLGGRTFRISTSFPASGTAVVIPSESTTYTVCVESDDYSECDEVRLVVVEAGDLMFTEVQPAPSGGNSSQWLEVRNVSTEAINLKGMALHTAQGGFHTIGSDVVLIPGEYAVLAASASSVAQPTYVYGTNIPLGATQGGITLRAGTTVLASAAWGGPGWNLSPGSSISLDGGNHLRGTINVSSPAAWCVSTTVYAGTDKGSPGATGKGCQNPNYDVDHYSSRPFLDIRDTGTLLVPLVTGAVGEVPGGIGFPMPYFGGVLSGTELWATLNGTLFFGARAAGPVVGWQMGMAVRGKPTFGMVAAYLANLQRKPTSSFRYETRTSQGFQVTILQWTDYQRTSTPGSLTFQVQLWENGDIVLAYEPFEGPSFAYGGGKNTVVGFENVGHAPFFQYLWNKPVLQKGGQVLEYRWKPAAP